MAELDFMRYKIKISFGQISYIANAPCFLAAALPGFFLELEEDNELLNREKIFTTTSGVTAELTLRFCSAILLVKINW